MILVIDNGNEYEVSPEDFAAYRSGLEEKAKKPDVDIAKVISDSNKELAIAIAESSAFLVSGVASAIKSIPPAKVSMPDIVVPKMELPEMVVNMPESRMPKKCTVAITEMNSSGIAMAFDINFEW